MISPTAITTTSPLLMKSLYSSSSFFTCTPPREVSVGCAQVKHIRRRGCSRTCGGRGARGVELVERVDPADRGEQPGEAGGDEDRQEAASGDRPRQAEHPRRQSAL